MAPSTLPDQPVSASAPETNGHKSDKRHRKDKDKSERKRARDGDEVDAPRKHKKHRKRDAEDANDEAGDVSPNAQLELEIQDVARKEKKQKKHKKSRSDEPTLVDQDLDPIDVAPGMTEDSTALRTAGSTDVAQEESLPNTTELVEKKKKKKSRKHEHDQDNTEEAATLSRRQPSATIPLEDGVEPKKKSKKKKNKIDPEDVEMDGIETGTSVLSAEKAEKRKRRAKSATVRPLEDDVMDIDVPTKAYLQPVNAPADPTFPFFTQKVYLYLPLYPAGFAAPISSIAKQHLEPLVNHYSPMLRGVVLGYSNVSLAHRPSTRGAPQTDDTPAVLESIDEYAVGFGWLTVDVSLFVPTRGAWMEGRVNLQNEGHIGVLCWDKFSASIDAKRLPPGWKWIDYTDADSEQGHAAANRAEGADGQAQDDPFADEKQPLHQMHSTGYWVDASGRAARGSLLFRIRDFEIGRVGDHGYLSIVGTMLTEEEERALETEEREEHKRRRKHLNPAGLLRAETRRVPEFSITTFGREDQEETAEQRLVFSKSRLNTPDD